MRITTLLGTAVLAGALLAGCGGGSEDSAGSAPAADAPMAGPAAPAEGQDRAAEAPDLSVDQRSIVYTGSITVRVDDVNAAAARASGLATAAGGFVGEDKRNSGPGSDDATLTLRVPAGKFTEVVNQLAALGKEETRGISTEDVTEQTVDLDARIAVQQARVDSGRRLLAEAKSLNDLVMLEKEVATRESDLASLQAKKRRLADLTALSTITVVLLDPDAATIDSPDGAPGFLAGLSGGWDALRASLAVLVTVLGALLPWLIALGLPAWGIFWAYRRHARRRPALVGAAPAFAAPVPAPAFAGPPAHPGPAPAFPGPVPGQPDSSSAQPASGRPSSAPNHPGSAPADSAPSHPGSPPAGSAPTQPGSPPAGSAPSHPGSLPAASAPTQSGAAPTGSAPTDPGSAPSHPGSPPAGSAPVNPGAAPASAPAPLGSDELSSAEGRQDSAPGASHTGGASADATAGETRAGSDGLSDRPRFCPADHGRRGRRGASRAFRPGRGWLGS